MNMEELTASNIKIRTYQATDRMRCIELFKSNCPAYFDPSELEGFEHWLNGQDNQAIVYSTAAAEFFYVLAQEENILGCGGFYIVKDKPIANLTWGMIEQQYHKKGFGSQLLTYRIAQIQKRYPSYTITLDTSQHTFNFFKRLGFSVTSISPNAYGPGLDRYDMRN